MTTSQMIVLPLTAVFVFLMCQWAKIWKEKTVHRFFQVVAILSLSLDPIYWAWELMVVGKIDIAISLPFYICSLYCILLPIAVFPKQGRCKRAAMSCLCTVCMMAGIAGLVFNYHWDEPFFSFLTLHSVIYHIIMILVVSMLWATKYYTPQREDRYLFAIPMVLMVLIALPLNWIYGWGYCFTDGGANTPFVYLSDHVPQLVFLAILYGGMFLLVNRVFYGRMFREKKPAKSCRQAAAGAQQEC